MVAEKLVQQYVDDILLVSDEEIAAGMAFALEKHHLVVEGGGAVGIAVPLHGRVPVDGGHIVVVVSGSNVDPPLLFETAQRRFEG